MGAINEFFKEKAEINNIKSIAELKNIKNDYFLRKLFLHLQDRKILDIVKYNKNIQKRLNLDINAYKEYSEIFSSIEIEIKPVKDGYGKFINIPSKDRVYYYIYFNNNKYEINKRNDNYIDENEEIKIIKIIIDYHITSLEKLFDFCRCIESINFKKFYRNNITNMSYMFGFCQSLKELNLNNFNTNNVMNMEGMFSGCSLLTKLNLNNFNTNNVTNMYNMFSGCFSLTELNLNNFNTNNVTNMHGMFSYCNSLEKLNLNNFNTNNVTDMSKMFENCRSLKELNLNNFNTNNITNINNMFEGCSKELRMKIKTQYKNIKDEAF